jgi:TetR/AcrR family transcriptional repressor of bet genes
LLRDVYAGAATPPPDDLDVRVRALVACLDGLALSAVATPDAYPPELVARVIDKQLELTCIGA